MPPPDRDDPERVVRTTVSKEDPPGGPLSGPSATILLEGLEDARAGRIVPLDTALLTTEADGLFARARKRWLSVTNNQKLLRKLSKR